MCHGEGAPWDQGRPAGLNGLGILVKLNVGGFEQNGLSFSGGGHSLFTRYPAEFRRTCREAESRQDSSS